MKVTRRYVQHLHPLSIGLSLLLLLLTGCGGGGGESAGSSLQSLYSGITSPAVMTQTNAEDLALKAYQAGDFSGSVVTLSPPGSSNPKPQNNYVLGLVLSFAQAAEKISLPKSSPVKAGSPAQSVPLAPVPVDDIIYDNSGGTAHITGSIDDQTYNFSFTVVFTNWHGETGVVINGTASASGHYDPGLGWFTHIFFTFDHISGADGPVTVTYTGTVEIDIIGSTSSATANLVLRDNSSNKTYWIDRYMITLTAGSGYADIQISGRLYLHDYGYVDLSTTTAIRFYENHSNPSHGEMKITGTGGKSLKFIVIESVPESTGYYVEADLDGNTVYEWRSVDHTWT